MIYDVLAVTIGVIAGRFLNFIIHRLSLEISSPDDSLFPLASFNRQSVTKWFKIFVQILTGAIFLLGYREFGLSAQIIPAMALACFAIVVAVIDLDKLVIPNKITYAGIPAGIILSLLPEGVNMFDSIIGAMAGWILFYVIAALGRIIFNQKRMGGGDLKFAALIGAFLGWKMILLAFIIASFVGVVYGALLIYIPSSSGLRNTHIIPFGPFLSVGALMAMFWGAEIINLFKMFYGL